MTLFELFYRIRNLCTASGKARAIWFCDNVAENIANGVITATGEFQPQLRFDPKNSEIKLSFGRLAEFSLLRTKYQDRCEIGLFMHGFEDHVASVVDNLDQNAAKVCYADIMLEHKPGASPVI